MKEAQFTVEFLRHVLANGVDAQGRRDRFQKTGTNDLVFQQSWWHSAIAAALPGTGLQHVKPGQICMDLIVAAPTRLYRRRYGDGQYRLHEAIFPGTRVTFKALVDDGITESVLRTIMDRVGRFIGISPYGHKLGFGIFRLVDVRVQPSEASGAEGVDHGETFGNR